MAPGLAFRILGHLKEIGLLEDGGTVLDPMGGIGTTGLCAALLGHPAVLVELEEKFVGLARQNAERIALKGFGSPIEVIQGDARHLSELLAEKGMVSVISPPYEDNKLNRKDTWRGKFGGPHSQVRAEGYGTTPGQIGNLPDAPITVTSPPYSETNSGPGGIDWGKAGRPDRLMPSAKRHSIQSGAGEWRYGTTTGQIGALPDTVTVTSPPYQEARKGAGIAKSGPPHDSRKRLTLESLAYSGTEGNIASLPDTVTVTSPPYEDSDVDGARNMPPGYFDRVGGVGHSKTVKVDAQGQIGKEHQESYLEAMLLCYREIAKVSPVLVCVLKDPTRNGKLRELGKDTWALMEQAGYTIVDYHRAILFEEQTQGHLFEGSVKRPRGRLGFFKRLAYRKGSQVANFEHVLIGVSA